MSTKPGQAQFCEDNGKCPGGNCTCTILVGFEGTGPTVPVDLTEFNTDPWNFSGEGGVFSCTSIEIANLAMGAVTESIIRRGALFPSVPALPLLALGAVATGLVALGTRAIRKR